MTKIATIVAGVLAVALLGAQAHGAAHARGAGGADSDATGAESAADRGDEGAKRVVKGRNDIEGEIIGTPAKGSPFAKLEIGMTQDEVTDMIGSGKQCGAYQTGKAWIPFRFSSSDRMRSECSYKGAGSLVYTQNKRGSYLLKIVNDASEDGIRD